MNEPEPIETKFPDMQPVSKAPTMSTINGIGAMLYGRRDYDEETYTYVKTLCFTLLFVPLFALKAYRVADAPQGWYFIGRVPLSGLAKAWNYLVLISILVCIGAVFWTTHERSPETIAARRLAEGDRLAEDGQVGQAANAYRQIILGSTSQASIATEKLQDLMDSQLDGASSAEIASALETALAVYRVRQRPTNILERGMTQAKRLAESDIQGALKILNVVEPLSTPNAGMLAAKRAILEKAVAQRPDDLDAVSSLAVAWEVEKNLDQCQKLLEKHGPRLGSREGARILGQIYSQKGELDRALPLLQAYVDARLEGLQSGQSNFIDLIQSMNNSLILSLQGGKAPGFDYNTYKKLDMRRQDEMVQNYIDEKIRNSPEILKAQEELRRDSVVVAVALDLGMVRLRRAQSISDPKARKLELEKAEKTFLALRASAGKSDEYRLNLGQVYYWLGKPAEARKLFDEILADSGRNPKMLGMLSLVLREVGAVAEARTLMEEAFATDGDPREKSNHARSRAAMSRDLDDRIEWLRKVSGPDRQDQAELAGALGDKAYQENRDEEAATSMREAIAHYAALPENSATLNNCALVHFSLFQITADNNELAQGVAKLEKAVAMEPRNSILIGNSASAILSNGVWELAGVALDRKVLRGPGTWDLLSFLYSDKKGRDIFVAKAKEHSAIAKARTFYERVRLLAPKQATAYDVLESIYSYCEDLEALRQLAAAIKDADLDLTDSERRRQELLKGINLDKRKAEFRAALANQEKIAANAKKVKGATLAAALANLSRFKLAAVTYEMFTEAAGLVELAEDANAMAPSQATRTQLIAALLTRAHMQLSEAKGDYAKLAQQCGRSLPGVTLIATVLAENIPARDQCREHPDVKRALAMLVEDVDRAPNLSNEWTWAMLRQTHPEAAARIAQHVLNNERGRLSRSINEVLQPLDATTICKKYWVLLIEGKSPQALAEWQRGVDAGIPLPAILTPKK